MSKMVTARVPDALFEQGSIQLRSLGATPSELVKAAFEYLLSERALPQGGACAPRERRELSAEQTERLREALRACSLDLDIPADVAHDKRIAHEVRSRHEALA